MRFIYRTPIRTRTLRITVPAELLEAAGVNPADASRESAKLLALELYRENKVSLGLPRTGCGIVRICRSKRSWSSRGTTKRRCTIASQIWKKID
jgi:hypothetical protein